MFSQEQIDKEESMNTDNIFYSVKEKVDSYFLALANMTDLMDHQSTNKETIKFSQTIFYRTTIKI